MLSVGFPVLRGRRLLPDLCQVLRQLLLSDGKQIIPSILELQPYAVEKFHKRHMFVERQKL
jgi:hypothetical protein